MICLSTQGHDSNSFTQHRSLVSSPAWMLPRPSTKTFSLPTSASLIQNSSHWRRSTWLASHVKSVLPTNKRAILKQSKLLQRLPRGSANGRSARSESSLEGDGTSSSKTSAPRRQAKMVGREVRSVSGTECRTMIGRLVESRFPRVWSDFLRGVYHM